MAPTFGDKGSVSETFQFFGKLQLFLKCPVVDETSLSIKKRQFCFLLCFLITLSQASSVKCQSGKMLLSHETVSALYNS